MQEKDIRIGKLYADGLGVIKKVVHISPNYNGWYDSPPVICEVVKDGTICNFHRGVEEHISLSKFASWAQFELG